MFTLGRFACQNKVKSFALSGCCNKMEFPPHPSSSSRQSLRQMFFSSTLRLTSHSASKQLATLPGIRLSSIRHCTGSFTTWTACMVGVSRARDRGKKTVKKSLLQLFLNERGNFTYICTSTSWGNVTRTDRKPWLFHWSQGAADNTNTSYGDERFLCSCSSSSVRSPRRVTSQLSRLL